MGDSLFLEGGKESLYLYLLGWFGGLEKIGFQPCMHLHYCIRGLFRTYPVKYLVERSMRIIRGAVAAAAAAIP